MVITKEQIKEITNLHIRASNIGRLAQPQQLIESILDILDIKHERFYCEETKTYFRWRIVSEQVEVNHDS